MQVLKNYYISVSLYCGKCPEFLKAENNVNMTCKA